MASDGKDDPVRLLLLGAGGKLGTMMTTLWAGRSDLRVVPVSRRPGPGRLVWAPGADPGALPRVDCVVAFWGVTSGDAEALAANVTLAEAAMRLGARIGARLVLHASSAAVYGRRRDGLTESADPTPANAYGHAKHEMERRVAALAAEPGAPAALCLRIANVAGADSLFAALRTRPDSITLDRFADGSGPVRSYIAPADLARVVEACARTPGLSGVLNVAAPVGTAMDAIARAAGRRIEWRAAPEGALRSVVLDTARLSTICPLPTASAKPDHLVASARAAGGLA